MYVAALIERAARRYNDLAADWSKERVTDREWVLYYNDAIRQVALVRPQSCSSVEALLLVAGVLQTIGATAFMLLDVIQNLGSDGTTAGNIITKVERAALDAANLAWPAGTSSDAVDNYAVDDRYPRNFWVTPPVGAGGTVYVQVGVAKSPTEATEAFAWNDSSTYALAAKVLYLGKFWTSLQAANTGNTPATGSAWWVETSVAFALPDIYAGPVAEWMVRLAFAADTESVESRALVAACEKSFYQTLGIKTQADVIISPSAQ